MTVQQLKYILKVAEVGSITEAAKLLFISQPSLSNSIKETEKEAGITIFLRSRIGITLTKDGAEFLGYARQVIQQMELLEDRYVTNLPGKVTFGVSSQHYTFTETCTWIGLGVLIQKFYLRHFRVIYIILALTLLECIWGMLR